MPTEQITAEVHGILEAMILTTTMNVLVLSFLHRSIRSKLQIFFQPSFVGASEISSLNQKIPLAVYRKYDDRVVAGLSSNSRETGAESRPTT